MINYVMKFKSLYLPIITTSIGAVICFNCLGEEYKWRSASINGGGGILYSQVDATAPNIIYAASDLGGIFKSNDRGDSWEIINEGLSSDADHGVATIAIHPSDHNTIFYWGW